MCKKIIVLFILTTSLIVLGCTNKEPSIQNELAFKNLNTSNANFKVGIDNKDINTLLYNVPNEPTSNAIKL